MLAEQQQRAEAELVRTNKCSQARKLRHEGDSKAQRGDYSGAARAYGLAMRLDPSDSQLENLNGVLQVPSGPWT